MVDFIFRLDAFLTDFWSYYFGSARKLHGVFIGGFSGYHAARNRIRGIL